MRARISISVACLLSPGLALAGCGGTNAADNGVAGKSPDAIVTAAANAVSQAKSVHVSGSQASGTAPVNLDLTLVAGEGGRGTVSESGLSFQIVALNQVVYVNASDAFWSHLAGNAAVHLLHGKWLKAPATGQFGALASLTDFHALFSKLLSTHGALAKGQTSTVAGQKVVAVNDTTKGGTLYVATTGKPYPVEIVKGGGQAGRIRFDRYDQSVSLSPPVNAVDISQLR